MANDVLLLVQVPPETESLRIIEEPTQTEEEPAMALTLVAGETVMVLVAEAVPQLVETI